MCVCMCLCVLVVSCRNIITLQETESGRVDKLKSGASKTQIRRVLKRENKVNRGELLLSRLMSVDLSEGTTLVLFLSLRLRKVDDFGSSNS